MNRTFDSPVLRSIEPVIAHSRHVRTDRARIAEHAAWMAYEELPFPQFVLPFGIGGNRGQAIDFVLVSGLINFAFTDFAARVKFQTEYAGRSWSDSEALFACLKRALDEGVPVLDGCYLSGVSSADLARVFRGNIELPMLDERAAILRDAGKILVEGYEGRFHNLFRADCRLLYDNGRGWIERLTAEFPQFRDASRFQGREVLFYKLVQLALWVLHCTLRDAGGFPLDDLRRMTAFADYIVPAALRVKGILQYTPELEESIAAGRLIGRDSAEEIEIRAHTIHASALLTEEVNRLRPADRQVIIPQIDARLWTHYHTTHWPHHLTRTTMY